MELKKGLLDYGEAHPGRKNDVRHLCLALRRNGIDTIEKLSEVYKLIPEELLTIRDIGPIRLELIGEIIGFHEAKAPPRMTEQNTGNIQGSPCISSDTADKGPLTVEQ